VTIAIPPQILLLEAAKATLDGVDFVAALAGYSDFDVSGLTVRHYRNRTSASQEQAGYALSIEWLGNNDNPSDINTAWDRTKAMDMRLAVSGPLKTEDSEIDPTGWLILSLINAVAVQALKDPASPLGLLYQDISDGDTGPDQDSSPDNGRLEQSLSVLYRVLTTDPNVLLAQGVDGG
jgi:hypothetical protein